jgi:hypothetical protein
VRASAENFLRKINGLPGKQATVQRVSYEQMEMRDKAGRHTQLPMAANVTYRRLLGGYEGVGPGGKVKVFHDMRGNVAGYLRVWRTLTPISRGEPLISLDEAVKRFKENPLGRVMLSGVTRVEVLDMRPAYLELGLGDVQQYVQPIFLFDCMAYVQGGDRESQVPYVRYMEALVKVPEPLWPEGKTHESIQRSNLKPEVHVGED